MSELEKQCDNLMNDCHRCADFLEGKPGLNGPQQVIDLYRAIARLAMIVKQAKGLSSIPARSP